MIVSTQKDGPAANAGLRKGDDILSIADRTVATMSDVQTVVEAHAPGQTVSVRYRRAHRDHVSDVRLGSRATLAPH